MLTVPHVGPRVAERLEHIPASDRLIVEPRTVMASDSFWNLALPANVALDPTQAATELQNQATLAAPSVNTHTFSVPVTLVPPDQPLVAVTLTSTFSSALTAVFATGLPIPEGFVPEGDADGHACFYQPDYVGPGGHRGRLYEAWKLKLVDGEWQASWGGRMVNTHGNPGYWSDWRYSGFNWQYPANEHSTYMEKSWGATATSLPLAAGTITVEDLALGRIEHAVGLSVIYARQGQRWPAQRNDGIAGHSSPIVEGMRLRFPVDHEWAGHPVAVLIHNAIRDYGCVVWDKAGALSFRAEPACQSFFNGTPGYAVLDGFPWGDLQVLATGSAENPNPA